MKSRASFDHGRIPVGPGRPLEIEEASNRYLIHPLSRALVDRLILTSATPNQVSISSVFAAGAAALCYLALPWPWGPFSGFACQIIWHVLDGADGDLARRSGRASDLGELIDGVCDHLSQLLINLAFIAILARGLGPWAWGIGLAAGLAHFVQSNAYETGRKTYCRWMSGARWMRQAQPGANGVRGALGGLYMAVSNAFSPGEAGIEEAMAPFAEAVGPDMDRARRLYRESMAPLVKQSGLLSGNTRTLASALSMLVGGPLWYFLFEIVVLNIVMAWVLARRQKINRRLAVMLRASAPASRPAP